MTNKTLQDVLHPSKDDLMKAELASPAGVAGIQETAVVDARKCMNAMKTVGAALHRAQDFDGSNQAEVFQSLLEEAGRVARLILIRWGVNPDDRANRWMVNVAEKSLLPHLDVTPLSDDAIDVLASGLLSRAVEHPSTTAWEKDEMIDLAIFRGLSKLADAQATFDFGRKQTLDKDLEDLRDIVLSACTNAMTELCPSLTPHGDRVVFVTMLVDQGFDLMDGAWRKNAAKANQVLSKLNKDQIKAWKQANPHGFELTPVIEHFNLNFGRLLRLTLAARKADRSKGKK